VLEDATRHPHDAANKGRAAPFIPSSTNPKSRTVGRRAGPRYAAPERSDFPKNRVGQGDMTTNRKNARGARAADAVLE